MPGRSGPTSAPAGPSITEVDAFPTGIPPGPLTYFQANCARCHGAYGQGYGPGFGKTRTPDSMRQIVDDMCRGPGGAPLAGEELSTQVAFHLALAKGLPYGLVRGRLAGAVYLEISPGTKLTAGVQAAGPFETHLIRLEGTGIDSIMLSNGTRSVALLLHPK
jgi:hypothetical protein